MRTRRIIVDHSGGPKLCEFHPTVLTKRDRRHHSKIPGIFVLERRDSKGLMESALVTVGSQPSDCGGGLINVDTTESESLAYSLQSV